MELSSSKPLDSVFLSISVGGNDKKSRKLAALPAERLLLPLCQEIERFSELPKVTKTLKEQFRGALLAITHDTTRIAKIAGEKNGKTLRKWWVDEVKKGYNRLFLKPRDESAGPGASSSAVDSFLDSLPKEQLIHPRGENLRHHEGHDDSLSDSSVSSFGSVDGSASTSHSSAPRRDSVPDAPLVLDDEAKRARKLMRETQRPEDLKERTATFVSDRFCFGSSYVMDMLQDTTKWPSWSRQQLHQACSKITDLYDAIEVREAIAEDLGAKARAALLKRESDMLRAIRTSLHIARLGPGGGKDFRDKVMTEEARKDFEASFANPKVFRLFRKSLDEVNASQKASSSRRRSSSRSSRPTRRSRSHRRRAPRTQQPRQSPAAS